MRLRPEITAELIDELVGGCFHCQNDLEVCLFVLSELTDLSPDKLLKYHLRGSGSPPQQIQLRCHGRLELALEGDVVELGAFLC